MILNTIHKIDFRGSSSSLESTFQYQLRNDSFLLCIEKKKQNSNKSIIIGNNGG